LPGEGRITKLGVDLTSEPDFATQHLFVS